MSQPMNYFFKGSYMFAFEKVQFVRLFDDGGCNVIFGSGDNYISLSGDDASYFILSYDMYLHNLEGEQ